MFLLRIFVHIAFLFSIFDIYFKSPIVKNIHPIKPIHDAVADRLVLFVVDGLRAESFVNHTTMPFLRSVANSKGRWGISRTQVPTESRPGHVAIAAGFYEDPSAVVKGWKENPVDFDSVFNQSQFTWCWGAYDIINIFTKDHVGDHIYTNDFNPYSQSFSTYKNTTLLDDWVFRNVKEFFQNAEEDVNLLAKLKKNKIVFFLHLLGTDTSGHTHKPQTRNFLTTLRFVDEGIKIIEGVINTFYNDDGKTTFLMTSDHGMTDWGSHGAGDNYETETPYVLWGSGVNQVNETRPDSETLLMSSEHRFDINQIDLAPIMATFISIPVPVNSLGQVKTDLLNMTLANKAKAVYGNSRQIAAQYDKKRHDVESNAISILYKPYEPLTKKKYEEIINFAETLLIKGEYEKLIICSEEIMQLSLRGLRYYNDYYQKPLLILVTLSFMGWIVYLLKLLSEQKIHTHADTCTASCVRGTKILVKQSINIIFLIIFGFSIYIVYVQSLPVQYFVYFLMPTALWWYAMLSMEVWFQIYKKMKRDKELTSVLLQIVCYGLGSIAMGLSFTYRWMLSLPLLGMALWPFMSSTKYHLTNPVLLIWSGGSLLLSIFSFMPVVGKNVVISLVIAAGVLWIFVITIFIYKILMPFRYNKVEKQREMYLFSIQILLLLISCHNIYVQSKRFEQGTPVSAFYQTEAWIVAVTSLIMPFLFSRRLMCRLMAINTGLINFYLLMSVSHEGLFMVALIINVMSWVFIEFRLLHVKDVKIIDCAFIEDTNEEKIGLQIERSITSQDFRRAFFFVLYIILAFFGTGNIASLNSFELRWVTCFITSFQPFLITTLILMKTLSPFLIVGCAFRAVQFVTKAPLGCLNIIVLIYSNIMGLQLLFYVRNNGSWLEIGTSISQFVIVQVITLFIVLINQIAKTMTDFSIYNFANQILEKRKKSV